MNPLLLFSCYGGSSIASFATAFLQPPPSVPLSRRHNHGSITTTFGRKKRNIRTNDALLSKKHFATTTSFDTFDYNAHWYPVIWSQDVPMNQPIRVTLFDVDYVLAKTTKTRSSNDNNDKNSSKEEEEEEEEETFYAMIDKCPHKKVALSEGRITDCGTKQYFQCSYHGEFLIVRV